MKLTAPLDIVPRQREHGTVAPQTHTHICCFGMHRENITFTILLAWWKICASGENFSGAFFVMVHNTALYWHPYWW